MSISRKELKKDEIRAGIVHGAEAAIAHQKQIWIYGGAVLAIVLAVVAWRFYSQRETMKASVAFEEASKVFNARIRQINEPEVAGEIAYVDEKNKFSDAAQKFEEIAQTYSRTRPGQMALYYAGLSYEQLGRFEAPQYDEAVKRFARVQSGGDAELAALARLSTARVYQLTGKGEEAVKIYEQLIANPSTMVPKPLVMLTLADYHLRSNPAEAQRLYTQITAEFPQTEVARAAQERLDEMPPRT